MNSDPAQRVQCITDMDQEEIDRRQRHEQKPLQLTGEALVVPRITNPDAGHTILVHSLFRPPRNSIGAVSEVARHKANTSVHDVTIVRGDSRCLGAHGLTFWCVAKEMGDLTDE